MTKLMAVLGGVLMLGLGGCEGGGERVGGDGPPSDAHASSETAVAEGPSCDMELTQSVGLRGEGEPNHQLRITAQGDNCLQVPIIWRLISPEGEEVWREETSRDDMISPDTGIGPETPAELVSILEYKTTEAWLLQMADLPEWRAPGLDYGFVTDDDLDGEARVDEAAWREARAANRVAWCWVPASHWAQCYWETPDGQIVNAFGLSWF